MEGYCGVAHSHVCNGGHGCAGQDCACPCHFDNPDDDDAPFLLCEPGCGAEVYDDGTHVLDRFDRESLGYGECFGRPAGADWWPPL